MLIRPYQPEDDPALMALERLSARGFPRPFVHFRRSFIARARLYRNHCTLVAIKDDQIVGVSSIIVKNTHIEGSEVKVAYSFDTRVHPGYRRQGIGHAMVEEKLKWARAEGAVGVYSLIVSTNNESLAMVAKSDYRKARLILHLTFLPYPRLDPQIHKLECHTKPVDLPDIAATYNPRDLYAPYVTALVEDLEYQRWIETDDNGNSVGLSLYNQSKVYMQISADAQWPKNTQEILRLGRNLQLFDATGMQESPEMFFDLFQSIRDDAVATNVNKLVWLLDRNEVIPGSILGCASQQKDYWLMFKSYLPDWKPNWTETVYLDPRDL